MARERAKEKREEGRERADVSEREGGRVSGARGSARDRGRVVRVRARARSAEELREFCESRHRSRIADWAGRDEGQLRGRQPDSEAGARAKGQAGARARGGAGDRRRSHRANDPCHIKRIAGYYEYTVDFTAPYWPQGQPVELFWSNMKSCWRFEWPAAQRRDVIAFVQQFFSSVSEEDLDAWVCHTDKFSQAVVDQDGSVLKPLELELLSVPEDDDGD